MRRFIMLAALVAGVAWLGMPGEAWAQNREKAWEVFPYIGHMSFSDPDFGDTVEIRIDTPNPGETEITMVESEIEDEPAIGLRFAYHWTKHQMIEFAFEGTSTDATIMHTTTVEDSGTGMVQSVTPLQEVLDVDIITGQINYVYNFFLHRRDKIVAYVSGGVGVVNTSVFGLTGEPDIRPILDEFVGETNDLMYNFGGGVRFFGSEKVGFRVDLRQVQYGPDNRDNQDYFEISAGVSVILGGV
jgi:hypothetical protein